MGPDEEGDKLRHKLVELNAALKKIDRVLDFSGIIRPLLVQLDALGNVPPSQPLLARMRRQVERIQQALARHQAAPPGAPALPLETRALNETLRTRKWMSVKHLGLTSVIQRCLK